jgi:hypothetical protein
VRAKFTASPSRGSWRWISFTAARTRFHTRCPSRLPFLEHGVGALGGL